MEFFTQLDVITQLRWMIVAMMTIAFIYAKTKTWFAAGVCIAVGWGLIVYINGLFERIVNICM